MRVVRCRDDRGAVLVIVAVFSLVAVLFLAFVVDIGNQRQSRRQLTTATDAPALAVAREWALAGAVKPTNDTAANTNDECSWTPTDRRLATDNNPKLGQLAAEYNCYFDQVTPFRGGVVTVRSRDAVNAAFGGVTGVDQTAVGSLTSVRVQPIPGGNVRPVAFCSGDFPWETWPPSSSDTNVRIAPTGPSSTVTFTNVRGNGTSPCRVNGNWSQVVFRPNNECPGQSNAAGGSAAFREQYENGTTYDVSVEDCVSRVPGNGGFASGNPQAIKGQIVSFPVFDEAVGGGAGIYRVTGFLEAFVNDVLHAGNTTTFVLSPRRYFTNGKCCLLNEFNMQIDLCDVGTIGGREASTASTDCRPRDTSVGGTTPNLPDPCTVQTITQPLAAPVVGETLSRDVPVEVVVEDSPSFPCGTLTLRAVTDTPLRSITSSFVPPRSGNTYTFRFGNGISLAPAGTDFRIEVSNASGVLDDDATMRTVAGCTVTSAIGVSAPASGSDFKTTTLPGNVEALAERIIFTVTVNDRTSCSLTGRLTVPSRQDNALLQVANGSSPNTITLTAPIGATNYKAPTSNSANWSLQLTGAANAFPLPTVTISR